KCPGRSRGEGVRPADLDGVVQDGVDLAEQEQVLAAGVVPGTRAVRTVGPGDRGTGGRIGPDDERAVEPHLHLLRLIGAALVQVRPRVAGGNAVADGPAPRRG